MRLEQRLLPAMAEEAQRLEKIVPEQLDDAGLAGLLKEMTRQVARWRRAYRSLCIPMAHGVRLFGEFYNDTLQPDDPFAFVDLLGGAGLLSLERNRRLEELAGILRRDPPLATALREGALLPEKGALAAALESFDGEWGRRLWPGADAGWRRRALVQLALQMAQRPPAPVARGAENAGKEAFLDHVPAGKRTFAARLLDLARASYRLRDNDNLYLARLEAVLQRALSAARRRSDLPARTLAAAAALAETAATSKGADSDQGPWRQVRARQLVGQPAGAGLAQGVARVIENHRDLKDFRDGEILVCDALDPSMTVVAPLAKAIVERRGGMLIHGAIIAREYGLPCVTGVPEATQRIHSGDRLTVDGFLGIVVLHS